MAKNPSTLIYWNDVETDKQFLLCSMSAQGLWWRMMAIMGRAGGYLKVEGEPVSPCRLAKLTGQDRRNVGRWLAQLEKRGIFSRDAEGTIFCRRMVRAHQKRPKNAPKTPREHEAQPGLFDQKPLMTQDHRSLKDSTSLDKPESLNAAREQEEKNEEVNPQARCARLGRPDGRPCPNEGSPGINETPARVVLVGANPGGTAASLPPPVTDNIRFGRQDQGRAYPLTGSASSPSNRLGALRGGYRRRARPPPCPKSPALKAKIKEQLRTKHARFLAATARSQVGAYWATCLSDDARLAQRVFDETDRRMRAEGWDDTREWKRQRGIAA